jgi:hypothetical protein
MTFPTVTVGVLWSDGYALLLIACGWWVEAARRRSQPEMRRSGGMAAMRVTAIAGVPVMATGLMMMAGLLGTGAPAWMAPWAVLAAPLLRLPQAWVYGLIGQHLSRFIAGRAHLAVSHRAIPTSADRSAAE